MYNTSKYFSYIYADRNVRPCTIQGYTLITFPKVAQYILCTTREETGKKNFAAKVDGREGNEKERSPHKKATKDIQIKKSHKKGKEAKNAKKGNTDTLLGDLVANTATGTEKGQKDKIGIDDIGLYFMAYQNCQN